MTTLPATIEQYHAQYSGDVLTRLKTMYITIKKEIPRAEESISYGLPTFKINNKPVVYYGGFSGHIGLYATPDGHAEFEQELSKYKRGKGSVQFPHNQPLPLDLIRRITKFRAEAVEGE